MIERERLEVLLAEFGPDEVPALARAALAAGAEYYVPEKPDRADVITSIFARRERTTRRTGQGSIGFAEGIQALHDFRGSQLVLAHIDDRPQDGYYFQLFLTPDLSRIVACFGVEKCHGKCPESK